MSSFSKDGSADPPRYRCRDLACLVDLASAGSPKTFRDSTPPNYAGIARDGAFDPHSLVSQIQQ